MSLDLLSGLVQGFSQTTQAQQKRKDEEELRKLQVKAFKSQLEAKSKLDDLMGGSVNMGSPTDPTNADLTMTPGKSLTEVMSDPQGQRLLLQGGMATDASKLVNSITELTFPKSLTPNPADDRRARLAEDKHFYETGRRLDGQPSSGLSPKQQAEIVAKRTEEEPKARTRLGANLVKADIVSKKVDKALENTGFFTTGIPGAVLGAIPGTSAYNLEKSLDTVKAVLGFQELQTMRDSSPTGGALGQIAVRELEFLQASVASLDKGQSPGVMRQNLQEVKTHFDNWKKAVKQAYEENYKRSAPSLDLGKKLKDDPLGLR